MSAALALSSAVLPTPAPPRHLPHVAAALGLDAIETQLLWILAAPRLSAATFRRYQGIWPQGPCPPLEGAVRAVTSSTPDADALLARVRTVSALARLQVLRFEESHLGGTGVRIAADVLQALQGRTPRLPATVRPATRIAPWGEAWSPTHQARLAQALAALQARQVRWVAIPSSPGDGVLDAVAAERPTLAIHAGEIAPERLEDALNAAMRHARLRRLWPLVIAPAPVWPAVRQWASTAGAVLVACPRGVWRIDDCQVVPAESLSVSARLAVWREEVDPVAAHWLARRYAVGRVAIQRAVDAVRLQGAALSIESLTCQLDHQFLSDDWTCCLQSGR